MLPRVLTSLGSSLNDMVELFFHSSTPSVYFCMWFTNAWEGFLILNFLQVIRSKSDHYEKSDGYFC